MPFSLERFSNGTRPRPPAEWYYIPYLMLFVTGEWALVSTVDDDAEVNGWFAHATKTITDVCGLEPLIIDSPKEISVYDYHSDLLEIPKRFLENGLGAVQPYISWSHKNDLFLVMEDLERKIIQMA